ncbi:MAG: hypothetical protein GXO40_05150 [Epsilonproteobacteria bacterium]|nr:hypothetical protein [Campylobacterota bacterium]
MKISVNAPCPCGSAKKYKKCCRIYHKGAYPQDVLTLMKSRYSAFAVGEIGYIIKTSLNQKDYKQLKDFSDSCEFKGLEILQHSYDSVTFRAHILCNGVDNSFVEKSQFIKLDGRWVYKDGEILQ